MSKYSLEIFVFFESILAEVANPGLQSCNFNEKGADLQKSFKFSEFDSFFFFFSFLDNFKKVSEGKLLVQ